MGKRKDLSPRKKGQISVLLKYSDHKQKEKAKKLNISTQTVSAIGKKLKMDRNINIFKAQGRENVDGNRKQHLGLIEKSKQ